MDNELYNVLKDTIEYLRDYYLDWNDYIERFSFPKLNYYYLLINTSSFYKMIDRSLYFLEEYNKTLDEEDLLYTLMFIPRKICFTSNNYNDIKVIRDCLEYNNRVLKKYKKYQETD